MFKFLFASKEAKVVAETQRETVERALGEVNEILTQMQTRPTLSFNGASGEISVILPDQMPDEALALPAPEPSKIAAE